MARIFALLVLVAAVTGAAAAERFPILQPDQMNADQKKLLEALLAGPRGGGNGSPEAVQKMLRGGPFNACTGVEPRHGAPGYADRQRDLRKTRVVLVRQVASAHQGELPVHDDELAVVTLLQLLQGGRTRDWFRHTKLNPRPRREPIEKWIAQAE